MVSTEVNSVHSLNPQLRARSDSFLSSSKRFFINLQAVHGEITNSMRATPDSVGLNKLINLVLAREFFHADSCIIRNHSLCSGYPIRLINGPNKYLTHLLQQFDTLDRQLLFGPTSDVWKLDVVRELDELVHSHDDIVELSSYLRGPHRLLPQQRFDLHVARVQDVFHQVGLVIPGQNSSMLARADCHPFGTLDSSPLTPNFTFTPPRLNLEVGIIHSAITMTILASLVDL